VLMRKTTGKNVRHVRELRPEHIPVPFNRAAVNHVNLLDRDAGLLEYLLSPDAQVRIAMERNRHGATARLSEDMVGTLYSQKLPSVFLEYLHDFPCRHQSIVQHSYCTIKGEPAFRSGVAQGYFSGVSGLGFFGLPGGGTVRIASTADGSYTPVCPIIFTGFIPFFCSLLFVAVCVMPKTSDISLMVISSMLLLSEYIAENKKSIGIVLFFLTNRYYIDTIIVSEWLPMRSGQG